MFLTPAGSSQPRERLPLPPGRAPSESERMNERERLAGSQLGQIKGNPVWFLVAATLPFTFHPLDPEKLDMILIASITFLSMLCLSEPWNMPHHQDASSELPNKTFGEWEPCGWSLPLRSPWQQESCLTVWPTVTITSGLLLNLNTYPVFESGWEYMWVLPLDVSNYESTYRYKHIHIVCMSRWWWNHRLMKQSTSIDTCSGNPSWPVMLHAQTRLYRDVCVHVVRRLLEA